MNPRHLTSVDLLRVPPGQCRWCGKPVKPPRQSWCDDTCVQAYLIRARPEAARRAVYARDRGMCAICGLDTDQVQIELRAISRVLGGADATELNALLPLVTRELARFAPYHVRLVPYTLSEFSYHRNRTEVKIHHCWKLSYTSLWEADHIIPVVEGGGSSGLENLRTLCKPCHRLETAKLRKRLARQRRGQPLLWEEPS